MMDLLEPVLRGDAVTWRTAVLALLVAFALTQAIAGVYVWTFRGMSYSRNFVQSLVAISIVVCTLMLAIGNSVAAGIGVAGGLSMVRFRTALRDPWDVVYVFAALAAGVAAGLQAYAAAIAGTGLFLAAALVLHLTALGQRREFDGLLRLFAPRSADAESALAAALKQHTRGFVLVTLRAAGQGQHMEHAYHVRIPDPSQRQELVRELHAIDGVHDVSLLLQEPLLEG